MVQWAGFLGMGLVNSLQSVLLFKRAWGYIFCSLSSFQFEERVYKPPISSDASNDIFALSWSSRCKVYESK
jgi:hypothetical protein